MTRFKELRRIERAIEYKDATELEWARQYCSWRIEHAGSKPGADHWRRILNRVLTAQAAD